MKKALIITDTFPPYKHIGRFRIQQFAKYLPQFGWEPIILTPTSSYLWEKDDTLVTEIPKDMKVFRPYMPLTLPALIRNVGNSIKKKNVPGTKSAQKTIALLPKKQNKGVLSKLKKLFSSAINSYQGFMNKHVLIPGTQILWVPFAVIYGERIIKKYDIDIIFSSVPVYSNHIVAYLLKLLTRKPWIADYRDLWTNDITRRKRFTEFRGAIERAMEHKLLKSMDTIVFVSAQKIPVIESEFSDIPFDNTSVIPNGFDPDLIPDNTQEYKKGKYFHVLYTGRITPHRHHNQFLPAVGKLINNNPELKQYLRLEFVGQILKDEEERFNKIVSEYSMEDNIIITGWVAHREILKKQQTTDILLLIVDDVKFANAILPGKAFEYIVSGRPILTLAPDGDTKNIIEETNTGIVVPPKDEMKIIDGLEYYFNKWQSNSLQISPDWDAIENYNRINLTRKLARLFNSLN